MRKGLPLAALILAAVMLLSGCDAMFERDYFALSAHVDEQAQLSDEDYIAVSTYSELRDAILYLIESFAGEGTLRAYGYSGDLKKDLPSAIYSVLNDEPIGVFAVEYIPYEAPVSFPGYDEVRLSVTYRKTEAQQQAIREVVGYNSFGSMIEQTLTGFQTSLVAQTAYYHEESYNVGKLIGAYYYAHPETALVMPDYSVNLYPESGLKRIIEIKLTYAEEATLLEQKSTQLSKHIDTLTQNVELDNTVQVFLQLYDLLLSESVPDSAAQADALEQGELYQKTLSSTAYGALIQRKSDSEGYALALKALCDRADIDCVVVTGRLNGVSHYWNIVSLDGGYYHVDPIAGDEPQGGRYGVFLLDDQSLPSGYSWVNADYPACEYGDYLIAGITQTTVPPTDNGQAEAEPSPIIS